jgi:hypothetical protein
MLTLDIIVQNPGGADAIVLANIAVLAVVAALVAGLWVVVARGRARRDIRDFDESASDRDLQALRHRRLVVLPGRKPRGPQAPVVSELEPTGEPEPTGLKSGR